MCLLWSTNWVFISQKMTFFIVTAMKTSNLTLFFTTAHQLTQWSTFYHQTYQTHYTIFLKSSIQRAVSLSLTVFCFSTKIVPFLSHASVLPLTEMSHLHSSQCYPIKPFFSIFSLFIIYCFIKRLNPFKGSQIWQGYSRCRWSIFSP
jgi:hypothetical protein